MCTTTSNGWAFSNVFPLTRKWFGSKCNACMQWNIIAIEVHYLISRLRHKAPRPFCRNCNRRCTDVIISVISYWAFVTLIRGFASNSDSLSDERTTIERATVSAIYPDSLTRTSINLLRRFTTRMECVWCVGCWACKYTLMSLGIRRRSAFISTSV